MVSSMMERVDRWAARRGVERRSLPRLLNFSLLNADTWEVKRRTVLLLVASLALAAGCGSEPVERPVRTVGPPSDATKSPTDRLVEEAGGKPADVRVLSARVGGARVVLARGLSKCLMVISRNYRSTGCGNAKRPPMASEVAGLKRYRISGVLQPGDRRVRVLTTRGRTLPVARRGRLFSQEFAGAPVKMSWTTRGGAERSRRFSGR